MEQIIWIGHRESEILKAKKIISYSITTWGSNTDNNFSYSSCLSKRDVDNNLKKNFLIDTLERLLKQNENCKIMCYTQMLAYSLMEIHPEFSKNFICLNPRSILELLNNKVNTKLWLSSYLPILEFIVLSGKDCQFEHFKSLFPGHNKFIIQEVISAGGLGTYLLNGYNYNNIYSKIKKNESYLISFFAEPSYSLNEHILVSSDAVYVFPGSVQIIEESKNNLIYSGADFVNYTNIEKVYKDKVYEYSKKIGELLKGIGYRGICGIDFLVYNDEVYFIEINPRFQASTILLNLALNDATLPSMQELQFNSFYNEILPSQKKIEKLNVPYSLYKYKKESKDLCQQYLNKLTLLEKSPDVKYLLYDGFSQAEFSDNTYLYQVIFSRNISSCGKDRMLHLHPNVPMQYFMDKALPLSHSIDSIIRLKIALLNQGVRILQEAYSEMEQSGGYNKSVFNSIDLIFFHYLRINTPVNINMSSLSPFSIGYQNSQYILYYYNNIISEINLEFVKSIKNLKTQNKIPYESIAFISGDRLRIKLERHCFFKMHSLGCNFCPGNNVSQKLNPYIFDDIKEVIDYCISYENFRHILIGGGSADPATDDNKILPIIEYIRSKTDKPIYLMCLPPNNIDYVDKYIKAGVSEIAFNLELFDRKLALQYMPGKGHISLEKYVLALEHAVYLTNKNGAVRTMLIAGIEKKENTLSAVKFLTSKGIQPMISIFRPTPNCNLSYVIQPSNEYLYDLYMKAEKICNNYNLTLGPSCPSCQNNTLSITLK